jgi:HK97 family phage prohead protease
MPYFIEQTEQGWNTVKDDGVILGQHKTKAQAIKQMVAVSLSERIPVGGELKRAVASGSYSPPVGVQDAAKRALAWIDAGLAGSGFTAVGRARAQQLASGADVSADVVNRMISYFARHEVDKSAVGFDPRDEGYPSPGRVAWDAWGGDAGQAWVNSLPSESAVRAAGDRIGISDFDDTLYVSGGLNQAVYDWIDSQDVDLVVVTGRHESNREETTALLNKLGVDYKDLIMQPDNQNDSAAYKGAVAEKFLADGLDVVFVVENNAEARAAYKEAGVSVVVDPANLPESNEGRAMEEMSVTELQDKVYSLKDDALETIAKLSETVYKLCEIIDSMSEPALVVEPLDVPAELMVEEDSVRFVEPSKVAELHERGERVTKGIEQRVAFQDLEIRQEGDGMTLRGYAAVFNSPSQPLPFIETIERGAFRDSLNSRNDIKLLWNHDTSTVLGSTRAGTLRLAEDERGLYVEANLPDTQAGRDAVISIQRGDVTGFSFGFRVAAGGDVWLNANERVLKRVNIHEVSVGVAFPAYLGTEGTANVRSVTDLTGKIARLAEIRGVSAEELTDALLALEAGDELTARQGELLTDTLGKVLKQDPEVTNPNAILDLKKKELDLLMKRV